MKESGGNRDDAIKQEQDGGEQQKNITEGENEQDGRDVHNDLIQFYNIVSDFILFFNSNELLSTRVLPYLRNTYKGAYEI